MTLFDEGPRSQPEPASPTESYYEFLNRVSSGFWQQVRRELERWGADLSASVGDHIRSFFDQVPGREALSQPFNHDASQVWFFNKHAKEVTSPSISQAVHRPCPPTRTMG